MLLLTNKKATSEAKKVAEDAQKMEKEIPNAGLAVIPGTGHFSFVENPYLFGRIMASYFGLE